LRQIKKLEAKEKRTGHLHHHESMGKIYLKFKEQRNLQRKSQINETSKSAMELFSFFCNQVFCSQLRDKNSRHSTRINYA
jgi:hypothetical protein